MDSLVNLDDLSNVLTELNTSTDQKEAFLEGNMSEEMKASRRRYEEYIKKHEVD